MKPKVSGCQVSQEAEVAEKEATTSQPEKEKTCRVSVFDPEQQ